MTWNQMERWMRLNGRMNEMRKCDRREHFMRSITLVNKEAQPPGWFLGFSDIFGGCFMLTNKVWNIWNPVLGRLPASFRGGPSGASEVRGLWIGIEIDFYISLNLLSQYYPFKLFGDENCLKGTPKKAKQKTMHEISHRAVGLEGFHKAFSLHSDRAQMG